MKQALYYLPRVLTILIAVFFSIFILEGFGQGFDWVDSLMHLLLTMAVLAATIIAWKWPKVGGWIFVLLGIFFSWFFHPLLPNGLVIGSAPFVAGVLFLIEWFSKKK